MAASKKPKKNPTFGNGDRRKATGQCRSNKQQAASNRRRKKWIIKTEMIFHLESNSDTSLCVSKNLWEFSYINQVTN
jgi:hypothetical protein